MIFEETPLPGAYIITPEKREDQRGFFARTWCLNEFHDHQLNTKLIQCNISYNRKKGTWRGMHYQAAPFEEAKLIRCTMGSIWDVIADLRYASPTFRQHFAVTLSANNRKMLYVPENFAHGFITLEDSTEVFYQISNFYNEGSARGFRWNDPNFDIKIPIEIEIISDRDRNYSDYTT